MGTRTARLLVAAALFLGAARAPAEDVAHDAARIEERQEQGRWVVDASFDAPASATQVWAVLADYDHLPRFVSSMRRCTVKERTPAGLVVEQLAVAKVLFFSRELHLVLAIQEDPARSMLFRDVSGTDFESYQGAWTLQETAAGTRVTYHLEARPRTGVPSFIGASVFKTTAQALLGEVRAEIARRASVADARE